MMFYAGIVIGGALGVLLICLVIVSGDGDEW